MLTLSMVTYNNERIIGETLGSVLAHLPQHIPAQLVIVDNRSQDGTTAILAGYAEKYGNVTLILNERNTGYGAGHNLAIRNVDSRYHVICNPDIILHDDVFTPLASFMDQNREIGILCPRFQFRDGRLQPLNRRYPTVLDLCLRRFLPRPFKPLFQKRLDYYEMLDIGYDDICDVPFLSGAFMFCRTEVFKQSGGFDPRYFLYFEDVDLCRRVQRRHRTVYFPHASVTHFWERSAHKNWIYTYHFIKSGFRYFNQWGYRLS
jgi:GT2 family glycosyltransferase